MLLFKIGIFNFDLSSIMSFLVGVVLGAIIIILVYFVLVLSTLKTKDFFVDVDESSITKEEVKDLVISTQAAFKDSELRGDKGRYVHCRDLCINLASAIAARFFPNSKFPLYELSFDEIIRLVDYIEKRVNEILDHKGLRIFRKLKVSTVVTLTTKANRINNSNIIKKSKDVKEEFDTIKKVVNVINPAWWFKKLVMDTTVNAIGTKICTIIIAIVAEETYKVYSKSVFNTDVEIETNVEEIMHEINADLKEATKEDEKEEIIKVVDNVFGVRYKSKSFIANAAKSYESGFDGEMPLKQAKENAISLRLR